MARISGRRGRVYFQIGSADTAATPLPFQAKWSISAQTDKIDVTSLEDENKTYVSGLPDASGTFEGFYDDASAQTYEAATDGIPRRLYLYPNLADVSTYWFGTVLADFSANGDVAGSVAVSASWSAASPIQKVTS